MGNQQSRADKPSRLMCVNDEGYSCYPESQTRLTTSHYGAILMSDIVKQPRFVVIEAKLKVRILEFLDVVGVMRMQQTCKKMYFFVMSNPELWFNMVSSNVFCMHSSSFLDDNSIVASFELSKRGYDFMSTLKALLRQQRKHVETMQLQKQNWLILFPILGILAKPTLPVPMYTPDVENELIQTWYQCSLLNKIQSTDIHQYEFQCCLQASIDPQYLVQLRLVILQDLIPEQKIHQEDQEYPKLIQIINSFFDSVYLHCQSLICLFHSIESQPLAQLQYFIYAWSAFQGSMSEIKIIMDSYLQTFDLLFDQDMPQRINQFNSESTMMEIWNQTLMNQEIQGILLGSFMQLINSICIPKNLKTNHIKELTTMNRYVQALIDFSSNKQNIHWLGHSQFQGCKHLDALIDCTQQFITLTYSDMLLHAQNKPIELLQIVQDDQQLYQLIFPKWLYDIKFCAISYNLLAAHLVEFKMDRCESLIEGDKPIIMLSSISTEAPESSMRPSINSQMIFSGISHSSTYSHWQSTSSNRTVRQQIQQVLQGTEENIQLQNTRIESYNSENLVLLLQKDDIKRKIQLKQYQAKIISSSSEILEHKQSYVKIKNLDHLNLADLINKNYKTF